MGCLPWGSYWKKQEGQQDMTIRLIDLEKAYVTITKEMAMATLM